MIPPVRWLGRACLLAGLLWLTGAADAQEPLPFGQGTHAFRALLKQKTKGFTPLNEDQFGDRFATGHYADLLLVMLGDTAFVRVQEARVLRRFVREGGALLVATDQKLGYPLDDGFGVKVTGDFLRVQRKSSVAYRGLPECPLIRDMVAGHPLFRGVSQIATNRPSNLTLTTQSPLDRLARFPPQAFLEGLDDPLQQVFPQGSPFAAGKELGAGKFLVLSDHSIFINDMMLKTDNDNFFFAVNCINWLTDNGRRNQVLFMEDSHCVTDFNLTLKEPPPIELPMPSEAMLIEHGNQLLAGLDEDDFFNRLINQRLQGREDVLLLTLMLVLTLLMVVFGFWRLSHARHRIERGDPLLTACLAGQPPCDVPLRRRNDDMRQQNNYWETARQLARQCFESARAAPALGDVPRITVRGSWWQRRALQRQVRSLWYLACGAAPERITARGFRRLQDQLRALRTALADGTVRFGEW